MKKLFLSVLTIGAMAVSCNPSIELVSTTFDTPFETQSPESISFLKSDSADITILTDSVEQTMEAFGTCFNELGWTSLSLLSEADRESIFKEMFEPNTGANFRICRMSVGANDFARDWYSFDETEGDFEMKNFSIDHDRETIVPFIKEAKKYNPDLKIWASPWSPPTWMKDNKHYACQPLDDPFFDLSFTNNMRPDQKRAEGVNMFIQEDAYFSAYALYFAKFIEAYRAEGINIFMVMPQNEFNSCQPFPSCTWTADGLNKFIGEYLGPKMKELGVEVMFGTMERPNPALAETSLDDPKSSQYLTGAGFQWAGKHSIGAIRKKYPQLKLYMTEQECGNGRNDWRGATYSYNLMKQFLDNGVSVYDYWNTSLKDGGMSRWGWRQNSLVVVDTTNNTFRYTPEYYVLKHASHYVLPGAVKLSTHDNTNSALAFRNTDGSYVLLLRNNAKVKAADGEKDEYVEANPIIKIGKYTFSAKLKPNSINTIVLPAK